MNKPLYGKGVYGVCRNCNSEVPDAKKETPCPECGTTDMKVVRNIEGVTKVSGKVIE